MFAFLRRYDNVEVLGTKYASGIIPIYNYREHNNGMVL